MKNQALTKGLVVLSIGLAASSMSPFLRAFGVLASATDFAGGVFDGLSVVAFCTAIAILARSGAARHD